MLRYPVVAASWVGSTLYDADIRRELPRHGTIQRRQRRIAARLRNLPGVLTVELRFTNPQSSDDTSNRPSIRDLG
jgi:hypothetical protein